MPRLRVGRPRTRPDHVLADKAYTSRKNRRYLRRRGIPHTIPERLDQQRHRHNRGSRGGRPTGFDSERYKKRNTVERAINKLKGFRAVATRYEKRSYIYLGTITLAALIIWLRTRSEKQCLADSWRTSGGLRIGDTLVLASQIEARRRGCGCGSRPVPPTGG